MEKIKEIEPQPNPFGAYGKTSVFSGRIVASDKCSMTEGLYKGIQSEKRRLAEKTSSARQNPPTPKDHAELDKRMIKAATQGRTRTVKMLLKSGIDTEAIDNEGKTVLMYAAKCGHVNVCDLLIGNGARVDSKDKMGNTALIHAARFHKAEICALLLGKGADMHTKNNHGHSAYTYALRETGYDIDRVGALRFMITHKLQNMGKRGKAMGL